MHISINKISFLQILIVIYYKYHFIELNPKKYQNLLIIKVFGSFLLLLKNFEKRSYNSFPISSRYDEKHFVKKKNLIQIRGEMVGGGGGGMHSQEMVVRTAGGTFSHFLESDPICYGYKSYVPLAEPNWLVIIYSLFICSKKTVVTGDSAMIQDETTENPAWFFNVLSVQHHHTGPRFKGSSERQLVSVGLTSPGIKPTT